LRLSSWSFLGCVKLPMQRASDQIAKIYDRNDLSVFSK
jgi:hypothetical protein